MICSIANTFSFLVFLNCIIHGFSTEENDINNVDEKCSLKVDPGYCDGNYRRWFYNPFKDDCQSFAYGGCGGNENNFFTREMCTEKCQPWLLPNRDKDPKCFAPPTKGPCYARFYRWFYNPEMKECLEFIYGGCHGNSNNYLTQEACLTGCDKSYNKTSRDKVFPDCTSKPDAGPCKSFRPHWFYNSLSHTCEEFLYGDCLGNGNNYKSEELCKKSCQSAKEASTKDFDCASPPEPGPCRGLFRKWFYNPTTKGCSEFSYGGCGGNKNNFETPESCLNSCQRESQFYSESKRSPLGCFEPLKKGHCRGRIPRYYYNGTSEKCELFLYGGCGGNSNNYDTFDDCLKMCKPECVGPPEVGRCKGAIPRFFYNATNKMCEMFLFGGCQAGWNNYETPEACELSCISAKMYDQKMQCFLPPEKGPCRASIPKWYYDGKTEKCLTFIYGGCGGNGNNFETIKECQECAESVPKTTPLSVSSEHFSISSCQLPVERGPCRANLLRWFFNVASQRCEVFAFGGCDGNGNNFEDKEICESHCNAKETYDKRTQCLLSPEMGPCRANIPKWYYDSQVGKCLIFVYGGCDGNGNRFENSEECEKQCSESPSNTTENHFSISNCHLPPDAGPCRANILRWFFNVVSRRCQPFFYGGCKGNANNFDDKDTCDSHCNFKGTGSYKLSLLKTADCTSAPETGTCRALLERWYYDGIAGKCKQFIYGGCGGNANNYDSFKECTTKCPGERRDFDVQTKNANISAFAYHACSQEPDQGPCRSNYTRWFYNRTTSMCDSFSYGAESYKCSLDPDSGPCRAHMSRWFYNRTSNACETFVFGGCGGNDNRYTDEQFCLHNCVQSSPWQEQKTNG
ncbi:unnamed protein product [Soboliphyme baturini]|uniref:Papilin n=1 Tax=Soboliphyme baturini TaxID=241478 RepID=A0A183IZP4_9BILA|nr:unnamed protein product [Soboliphyme baturini]